MNDSPHNPKKMHSEQASDEIRADELIKATEIEASKPKSEQLRDIPVTNSNYWRFKGEDRKSLPKGLKWGIAGIVVLFVGGSVLSLYILKKSVTTTLSSQIGTLQSGVQDLQNLNPGAAQKEFQSLSTANSMSGLLGAIETVFAGSSGAVRSFTDLSTQLATLSGNLAEAENDVFSFTAPSSTSNGSSTALVSDLSAMKTTLAAIDADTNQLSSAASYFGDGASVTGGGYLSLKTQIESAEKFLNAFVPWLSDASSTHHLLVLLENPSEMRPGGGFIGSYADVSISGGRITDLSVHDISDVNKTFTQKIVPPVPLQLEETAFRPADGNWFFDFPTSASETISLFENSGLYATTTFDGVIAVTPHVLSDMLSVTGPVTVGSTTFNSDNLTVQIQKIVQAGQAKSASGLPTYPKGILSTLWQSIFQNLASSSDTEKQQLLALAFNWISSRNLMFYFNDSDLQSFVAQYGATGAVYQLPANTNADYLAVVNTDVNSDKSELYMAQTVNYDATINTDGTLADSVTVTRAHNGKQSPYWWYQTTNQDYMQVFVPAGATVTNESGGITKNVPAPINYTKQGYSIDPLILAIQSSTVASFAYPTMTTVQEFGKEVLGIWDRTYAGDSTQVSLNYTQHLYAPPTDGLQYEFVFEHQSGAVEEEKIEIDAPLGYVFADSGLATFTYDSTSTPGSMVVNLTLQKQQ